VNEVMDFFEAQWRQNRNATLTLWLNIYVELDFAVEADFVKIIKKRSAT